MKVLKTLSKNAIGLGCTINVEIWESPAFEAVPISYYEDAIDIAEELNMLNSPAPETVEMTVCRNAQGHYVGDETTGRAFVTMGIRPELAAPTRDICSVGFCEADYKWHGWSHRANYSFGVGSVVERGDCAYKAPNKRAYGDQMLDFFVGDDGWHTDAKFKDAVDADGLRGVEITALYTDDVPNEKLRGTVYKQFSPYPEQFGRGEWVAETLEDARQMAVDFADNVS